MPINNITQTISTIPPAGARGVDVQTVFVNKQEDFQDHLQGTTVTELNTLKDQLNTRIGEINSTTTTMNGYADTASSSATTATTKAGEAATSATAALTSKNQASTFATNSSNSATKSSQWADNNYNVAVETGKYSAKHWSTVAQNATANKVDKVTSTDNAVVRFDGTTGAVQNSGVIIDDDGNLGIGVTPSAWVNEKAIQVGVAGSLSANNNVTPIIHTSSNTYTDSSWAQRYIVSAPASTASQYNGAHTWRTAPSGTAGSAITWTNAMTLGASGNLLIGTTTDNGVDNLQVNGSVSLSGTMKADRRRALADDSVAVFSYSQLNVSGYGMGVFVLAIRSSTNDVFRVGGIVTAFIHGFTPISPSINMLNSSGVVVNTTNIILTGTSGTDGCITVSSKNSNFYIENRSGQIIQYSLNTIASTN